MAKNEVTFTPRVDVYESPEDVVLVADLPGVPSDALNVKIERNAIHLEAPRGDGTFWRRAFTVPATYDTARADATLKDGVLTLKLPRSEAAKPRRIEVKAA